MKYRIKWCEIWFHDKTFKNNIPEIVAKFVHPGDTRLFFNQFYPRYADRDCSITLTQGPTVLHQIVFDREKPDEDQI